MIHQCRPILIGWLLIFVGLFFNEWILVKIFSTDGILELPDRIAIWVFDTGSIILGAYLIYYKRSPIRFLGRFLFFTGYILFLVFFFSLVDIYLGYRNLTSIHNNTFIKDVFIPDNKLGWRLKPNSLGIHRSPGNFDVIYKIDEHGFKWVQNQGIPDYSIYFFGDSFTFGHGVENHDTFPNIISERYLKKNVHIINAGVSGYGIVQMFQHFLDIQHMIKKKDIVIFTPISTAGSRNMKDYVFVGQFVFQKQEIRVDSFPSYENGSMTYLKIDTPYNIVRTLLLYGRFTGRLSQLLYRKLSSSDTNREGVEMINKIRSITEEKGARFGLIFLPVPNECLIRRYYEDISSFQYMDIMSFFPSHEKELDKITFCRDNHWNRRGHEIAARAIAHTLVEKGLIDKGDLHDLVRK